MRKSLLGTLAMLAVSLARAQAPLQFPRGTATDVTNDDIQATLKKTATAAVSAPFMPAVSRLARADTYPSHPVHVVVPQAAASSTDIHARLISQWLQDHLGQPFVVDVKPGAGGNVGTEYVVHAANDGYTLLTVNSQNAISPSLYPDLKGQWERFVVPGLPGQPSFDQTKPGARGSRRR